MSQAMDNLLSQLNFCLHELAKNSKYRESLVFVSGYGLLFLYHHHQQQWFRFGSFLSLPSLTGHGSFGSAK